jgi:hypothetical protein
MASSSGPAGMAIDHYWQFLLGKRLENAYKWDKSDTKSAGSGF